MQHTKFYVRRHGRIPQDVIEVVAREADEVRFFPVGGGFEYRMPAAKFDATHREVSEAEYRSAPVYPALFDIDGMFGALPGYSFGDRWNGWACPYFPRESCDRIAEHIEGARYDPERDAFLLPRDGGAEDEPEFETYLARMITVAGVPVKVWGIGCGSWTWEEET